MDGDLEKDKVEVSAEQEVASTKQEKEDELIPFAWRHPLEYSGEKKPTKVLKTLTDAEKFRKSIVPIDKR